MPETKLQPLERHEEPVSPEHVDALEKIVTQMISEGWSDFEISYDLARTNGITHREAGRMFGAIHLVALVRRLSVKI